MLLSEFDLLEDAGALALGAALLPFDDDEDSDLLEVSDLDESDVDDSDLAESTLAASALEASALGLA